MISLVQRELVYLADQAGRCIFSASWSYFIPVLLSRYTLIITMPHSGRAHMAVVNVDPNGQVGQALEVIRTRNARYEPLGLYSFYLCISAAVG